VGCSQDIAALAVHASWFGAVEMPVSPFPPDDNSLRGFLLGTLPTDRAEEVRSWLDSDPVHLARLDQMTARDPLVDALCDPTEEVPVPDQVVERVIRAVSDSLHTLSPGAGDTRSFASDVRQSTTESTPEWLPARLGGYRIVRELGHGGMGYVFEAEDETLGRRVALKILNPNLAKRPDATARFLREARAVASVDHENVVPILHIGEDGGAPFIVMPLLKGKSLADQLKRVGKLPIAEVIRIGRDVAAGLSAAHMAGIVHRDLKPANVWLDAGTGRARVLDFGLARQGDGTDAMTEAGALLGTPAYMSPEQLDGKAASAQSDLFGLGAVLYECATGKRAFDGPTITAILKAVSDHHPAPPNTVNPDVPPALSALIVRLLAKKPTERPATAAVLLAALADNLQASVVDKEATVTWVNRVNQSSEKRRRSVWTFIILALAALVVVGVWLATRSSNPTVVNSLPSNPTTPDSDPPASIHYNGKVDVLIARTKDDPLQRLNEAGVLPMRLDDTFRIEGKVDPPAYVYVVWVDPDHDITPVYPWDPKMGWGSRPTDEKPVSKVSLPPKLSNRYTASTAMPGVATMVLFARPTPLDVPDVEVEKWFKNLPELPLPPRGDNAAIWFDNYLESSDPSRRRSGFGEVSSVDAFARWQVQLQNSIGTNASFQTAVSFARTGRK